MPVKSVLLLILVLRSHAPLWAQQAPTSLVRADKTVFVAGRLTDEELLVFTAAVAARQPQSLLLFDSPTSAVASKAFLKSFQPQRVKPVGPISEGATGLGRRLGVTAEPALEWEK